MLTGSGGPGGGESKGCLGADSNETGQPRKRVGEELRRAPPQLHGSELPSKGPSPRASPTEASARAIVRNAGTVGGADRYVRSAPGTRRQEVSGHRGGGTAERRGTSDRTRVSPDTGGQTPIQEEPNGGGIRRVQSEKGSIGRLRQAAGDHQGRRRLPSKTGRGVRQLHSRPIRAGQRSPQVGTQACDAGWEERQTPSNGCRREKTRRLDASAMGDRRGVRTVAELNEVGRLIAVPNGQVRGKDQTESEAPPRQGDGPERETTNRPVRVTAARITSLRARPVDGSTQTVRTPMCTGPQMRPTKSADGSVAERLLVTVSASRSMPSLDPERPPHGSARRARGTPPEVAQHLLGGGAPGDHRQAAAPSTAGALPNVGLEGVSLKERPVHSRAPVLPLQGGAGALVTSATGTGATTTGGGRPWPWRTTRAQLRVRCKHAVEPSE